MEKSNKEDCLRKGSLPCCVNWYQPDSHTLCADNVLLI